jgi:hypothetical protein
MLKTTVAKSWSTRGLIDVFGLDEVHSARKLRSHYEQVLVRHEAPENLRKKAGYAAPWRSPRKPQKACQLSRT